MVDLLQVTITSVLLTVTVIAALSYYRFVRKAHEEYDKAKSLVEDVVVSFSRELRKETEKLDRTGYRIETNSSKIESVGKRVAQVEKQIAPAGEQIKLALDENQNLRAAIEAANTKVLTMETAHASLKTEMAGLREEIQRLSIVPELKVEPVIPIRRDKAMGSLTDTEITVLEMLTSEGSKTAPEIKERVKLSREHTARLMKKLYEGGYLERETGKIPFKYNVKKEMQDLLKKAENTQM